MDDFRMGPFLVVVICIFFFACFRVVVYLPPAILIRHGRTIIPTTHRVSQSVRQTLLNNCYPKPRTRTMGVATWGVGGGGGEDEAKGYGDNQSI